MYLEKRDKKFAYKFSWSWKNFSLVTVVLSDSGNTFTPKAITVKSAIYPITTIFGIIHRDMNSQIH